MKTMLKDKAPDDLVNDQLKKVLEPFSGEMSDIPLGHLASGTGLSRGAVYFVHCSQHDRIPDALPRLPKAIEGGFQHRPLSWGFDFFSAGVGSFELLGAVTGIRATKGEIVAVGRRSGHEIPPVEELYPDLDIPAIFARARELNDCANDSEAISRVLDEPVQVVHQAE